MILHPVLGRTTRDLFGRAGVEAARRVGRAALETSARLARRPGTAHFPRDETRAPRPARSGDTTWHFSTTNTTGLAAAVVAPARVGIDAEWLDRPRLGALLGYQDARERARLGLDERRAALLLWSAKESVLKLTGVGLAGMGRVRLEELDGDRLWLRFDGRRHEVLVLWEGEHVVTLACDEPGFRAEPAILEAVAS